MVKLYLSEFMRIRHIIGGMIFIPLIDTLLRYPMKDYIIVFDVVFSAVAWIILDYMNQKKEIRKEFERRRI